MAGFNLILFFSVVSTTCFSGDALIAESIISTNEAEIGEFTYQAAIMAKPNNSHVSDLVGNGAVMTSTHVLSVAQIFIEVDGKLKELRFSVVVNEVNLKAEYLLLTEVKKIYLAKADSFINSDIAVLELLAKLPTIPNLIPLEIPEFHPGTLSPAGLVSGYGFHWVTTKTVEDQYGYLTETVIDGGDTDGRLRYEKVGILPDSNCVIGVGLKSTEYFCGKMYPSNDDDRKRGLCILDYGSPFVIKKNGRHILAGLASSNNKYCNDEALGGLYTKVGEYSQFINEAIKGKLPYRAVVYNNPRHVMDNELPECSASSRLNQCKII